MSNKQMYAWGLNNVQVLKDSGCAVKISEEDHKLTKQNSNLKVSDVPDKSDDDITPENNCSVSNSNSSHVSLNGTISTTASSCEVERKLLPVSKRVLSSKNSESFSSGTSTNVSRAESSCSNSCERCCRSETSNNSKSQQKTKDRHSINSRAQRSPSERPSTSGLKVKRSSVSHAENRSSQIHSGSCAAAQHQQKNSPHFSRNNGTSDSNSVLPSSSRSASRKSREQLKNSSLYTRDFNINNLHAYEYIFFNYLLIRETFAIKLDKMKQKAYALWFKCLEHQYSSGRRKIDKKNSVVKKFVKKDNVFRLSVTERNKIADLGIPHVKETCFGEFMCEFAAFINSPAYKNAAYRYLCGRN